MRRCPSWLSRTAAVAACALAISYLSYREDGSRASAVQPEQVTADARRIPISSGDATRLAAGHRVKSLLNVDKRLSYGDFVWDDKGVPPGDLWIRVDLSEQLLSVFRGGDEIGTAVIMYGGDGKPTPTGQFSVLWKNADHRSSLYDAKMPYMLRLTGDGISIHAADVKARTATNGCISIPAEFAKHLFDQAKVRTPVTILMSGDRQTPA